MSPPYGIPTSGLFFGPDCANTTPMVLPTLGHTRRLHSASSVGFDLRGTKPETVIYEGGSSVSEHNNSSLGASGHGPISRDIPNSYPYHCKQSHGEPNAQRYEKYIQNDTNMLENSSSKYDAEHRVATTKGKTLT